MEKDQNSIVSTPKPIAKARRALDIQKLSKKAMKKIPQCWKGMNKKYVVQAPKVPFKCSEDDNFRSIIGAGSSSFSTSFSLARRMPSVGVPLQKSDVQLRLLLHHGIPTMACAAACDSEQCMLCVATRNGKIKFLGDSKIETLLQSSQQIPIQFLQFFNNGRLIASCNTDNNIEVWELDSACVVGSYRWETKVTTLSATQDDILLYVGDESGKVGVLQCDLEKKKAINLVYNISLQSTFGVQGMELGTMSVIWISALPNLEQKRFLLCYKNGLFALWSIPENAVVAVFGGTLSLHEQLRQAKKITYPEEGETKELQTVCWVCPKASTFAAGYMDGDIWLWSVSQAVKFKFPSDSEDVASMVGLYTPLCKVNVGSVVPIVALRWWTATGSKQEKDGYICALGGNNAGAYHVLKVISLKDVHVSNSKCFIDLHPPEHLVDCLLIESWMRPSKSYELALVALNAKGQLFAYDMNAVHVSLSDLSENGPLLPTPIVSTLLKHGVTASRMMLVSRDQDAANKLMKAHRILDCGFSCHSASNNEKIFFRGSQKMAALVDSEAKGCCLYITGYSNGSVKLWDLSTPYLYSVCTLENEDERESAASQPMDMHPVSAIDYCPMSGLLVIGFTNGVIALHKQIFRSSDLDYDKISDSGISFMLLTKLYVQKNSISCLVIASQHNRVALGTETGMVMLIDLKRNELIQADKMLPLTTSGILSLCFVLINASPPPDVLCCGPQPIRKAQTDSEDEKLVLLAATKSAEFLLIDALSGAYYINSALRPKKASNAISMQVLDAFDFSLVSNGGFSCHVPSQKASLFERITPEISSGNSKIANRSQFRQYFVLLITDNSVRIYNMQTLIKGIRSPLLKAKLDGVCCCSSTFQTPDKNVGLDILYASRKLEIRSLPSLNVLASFLLDDILTRHIDSPDMLRSMSCTISGQTTLIACGQELALFSVLHEDHDHRFPKFHPIEPEADLVGEIALVSTSKKSKKKKLFGRIKVKNINPEVANSAVSGAASPKMSETDSGFTPTSYISSPSRQSNDGNISDSSSFLDNSSMSVNIDDIDIEDDSPIHTDSSKPAYRRGFLKKVKKSLAGKQKSERPEKGKEKIGDWDTQQLPELAAVGRPRTVDEIKATYVQGKDQTATSAAAAMRDKLVQQKEKLKAIKHKTSEMQDGAQNFQQLAHELVRTLEERNKRRFF